MSERPPSEVSALLYVETRPPVIWTGKNECGRVETWVGCGRVKKCRSKKGLPKADTVSYALKVSVNGVTCVCSPF